MPTARFCLFHLFVCVFATTAVGKPDNLKICVLGNPKLKSTRQTKFCNLLEKSKRSPVSCVYRADRLECLLAVSKRQADFGIFEPEDLYFASLWPENSILVVSEIRGLRNNPFEFGTVALVRKDSNITGIGDLRGKKLCHPGTENGPEWTPLFAEYFEERVAPTDCDENLSVLENRIKATSEFFDSACKAGPWSVNPIQDAYLKKKYHNLCDLCDSGDCRNTEKYRGSGGSITCLRDQIGDILWARHEDVKAHLKFLEENSVDPTSDFYYLCDDGTLMSITSDDPCLWLAKPWQVVAANRKSATDVQKMVDAVIDDEHNEWEENLLHVIELYLKYIQNVVVARTSEDYLRKVPGFLSANVMSEDRCRPWHSVKFCISSPLEASKCEWISKAGSSIGIRPSIECVQKSNLSSCLDSVSNRVTDVVVVPPDFLYDATTKFQLKTFLIEIGNDMNSSYLVSLVAKKKSQIKTIEDIKGKKLCLTRKNGIGWKSLLELLRENSLIESQCDDKPFSEYFKDVCFATGSEQDTICCSSSDKVGRDDEDILRCLQKDGCDVAVVDSNTLKPNSDSDSSENRADDFKPSDFRKICPKGKQCDWVWSYPGYLMTHADMTTSKGDEIYNVFFLLGEYFGKNSKKKNTMMEIFRPFHQISNVLFKDTSTSFVSPKKIQIDSNNYFERMTICSKATPNQLPSVQFLVSVVFFVFYTLLPSLHLTN